MDEPALLQRTLECLAGQHYGKFRVVICVNQPEAWWADPRKVQKCLHNRETLEILRVTPGFEMVLLDHSSPGKGWTGKKHGVGQARKVIMDYISYSANPADIILSLDADTTFSPGYLGSVAENFAAHPDMTALAIPYFHRETGEEMTDRAMLRYEIYMRHYFLSMASIDSPYAFTALGSALAVPVSSYRAIGGMTPKLSGEDFYFLQKLVKYGILSLWNSEVVYPEARFSDRVFFGTGPAMIKGATGDWSSYPIYPSTLFDNIRQTYELIPELFRETIRTPVIDFIADIFRESDPLEPLRKNHRDLPHFTRAFHEKFDGLRILQYLKTNNDLNPAPDEENLAEFLNRNYTHWVQNRCNINFSDFSFEKSPVSELAAIRGFLYECEMEYRATSAPR